MNSLTQSPGGSFSQHNTVKIYGLGEGNVLYPSDRIPESYLGVSVSGSSTGSGQRVKNDLAGHEQQRFNAVSTAELIAH